MKGLAREPRRDLSQEELDRIWQLYGDHLGGGECQRQESGQIGLCSDLLLTLQEPVPAFHPSPPLPPSLGLQNHPSAFDPVLLFLTWLHVREHWLCVPTYLEFF